MLVIVFNYAYTTTDLFLILRIEMVLDIVLELNWYIFHNIILLQDTIIIYMSSDLINSDSCS